MIGLLLAAAALLGVAGASKCAHPRPGGGEGRNAGMTGRWRRSAVTIRLTGTCEVLLAALSVIVGGRLGAALIAAAFGGLALTSIRLMRLSPGEDCGCFAKPSPLTHWHTAVNVGYALAGAIAIAHPSPAFPSLAVAHPWAAAVVLGASLLLAYLSFLLMTVLPELLHAADTVEVTR